MEERLEPYSPSLKHKLKHTICGCFKQYPNHYDHLTDDESPTSNHRDNNSQLKRTSSIGGGSGSMSSMAVMMSSRSEEFNLKHKCRSFMSRMGTSSTPRGHQHRKSHSTDFRYDPLSYALNFQEEDPSVDDFPYRNFESRLPRSLSRRSAALPSTLGPLRSVSDGALARQGSSSPSGTASTTESAPNTREIIAYS